MSTQDVLKAAEPVVKTLNDLTNESVFVGIFDKGNVVHLYVVSERGTIWAFKVMDTSEAAVLLPGDSIIIPSYL